MSNSSRRIVVTGFFALIGLCMAVGLAYLTSHLSTQQIGLAGESPNAGVRLVAPPEPAAAPVRKRHKKPAHKRPKTSTTTSPATLAPVPAPAPPVNVITAPPVRTQTVVVTVPRTAPTRTTPTHHRDDSHNDGGGTTTTGTGGHRDD